MSCCSACKVTPRKMRYGMRGPWNISIQPCQPPLPALSASSCSLISASSSMITRWFAGTPYSFVMVFLAWSTRPCRKSYRGLSGKKMIPMPRMRPQRKVMPSGMRHDPELSMLSVPKLMQYATKMPSVTNNWYELHPSVKTSRCADKGKERNGRTTPSHRAPVEARSRPDT